MIMVEGGGRVDLICECTTNIHHIIRALLKILMIHHRKWKPKEMIQTQFSTLHTDFVIGRCVFRFGLCATKLKDYHIYCGHVEKRCHYKNVMNDFWMRMQHLLADCALFSLHAYFLFNACQIFYQSIKRW